MCLGALLKEVRACPHDSSFNRKFAGRQVEVLTSKRDQLAAPSTRRSRQHDESCELGVLGLR
jgi:hypothetical protein